MKKLLAVLLKYKVISIIAITVVAISTVTVILLNNNSADTKKNDECIVQYESNGGSLVKEKKVKCGTTIKEPSAPVKVGFIFKGWLYNQEYFVFTSKIDHNLVLQAFWESDGTTNVYKVYFYTDGGSLIMPIEVSEGSTLTPPLDPVKEGYKFDGWFTDKDLFDFKNTPIIGEITLIARWTKIKNDSNNGNQNNNNINNSKNNSNSDSENASKIAASKELFSKLNGTWYLEGYSDVILVFEEKDNGWGSIWYFMNWYNIDLFGNFGVYASSGYSSGDSFEKENFIEQFKNRFYYTLTSNSLILKKGNNTVKFVRAKGKKDKYEGTVYPEILGTWYLEGQPNSTIIVTSNGNTGILNYDSYCMDFKNFSYITFELNTSGGSWCTRANDNSMLERYGILLKGDVLTITNSNGTRKFTKLFKNVTGVSLNKISTSLQVNKQDTLIATVSPANANNKTVTWITSNSGVATVNSSGVITAVGLGTATITATTVDGSYKATCTVTVITTPVKGISLNQTSANLYYNKTLTLVATVTPTNATNKNVIWNTSNSSVATVNLNGVVTAVGLGTTTITVTTVDGSYKETCNITVTYEPLVANGVIANTTMVIGSTSYSGMRVTASASGGNGNSIYYFIKLYHNGSLIGQTSDTSSNILFVDYSLEGTYTAEITVRDSAGNESSVTKQMTKN